MLTDFRERGKGKEKEKEKMSINERNIDPLPPILALTRDWTSNLLVYRTMFQPTEPPGQGHIILWYSENREVLQTQG